jgi:hypothetical protein
MNDFVGSTRPSCVKRLQLVEIFVNGERVREYTVEGLTPGNA